MFSSVVHSYTEETAASVDEQLGDQLLADVSDLSALSNQEVPHPTALTATIQETTVQASAPADTAYLNVFKPDQIVQYTVQGGDNISSIASDFGVSVNTIIWANNIKNPNSLSVGEVLKIPPVSGVIHVVKKGDNISSIAKKYNADGDKILSFNDLKSGDTLSLGDEIIVPGGELPGPVPKVKITSTKGSIYVPVGDGQCVAFVQAHGYANLHGNAKEWARYIDTNTPSVGDVVVFRGGRYGHVALITAVIGNSIQVVEQNFYGLYVIDHREVSLSNGSIIGFVR